MKKENESSSLPIACPNVKCGEVGWIPINRLDRQLVCRACGTRFYMDSLGAGMAVGERPKDFPDPFYIAPPKRYRPNPIERVEKWYRNLTKRTQSIIKSVAVTPLVIFAGFWLYTAYLRPAPKLPNGKDLSARAIYIVKAFSNDKPETIALVTNSPSLSEIKSWMQRVRPATWPRVIKLPKANVRVMSQSTKSSKATVSVEIEDPTVLAKVASKRSDPVQAEGGNSTVTEGPSTEDEKDKVPARSSEGEGMEPAGTSGEPTDPAVSAKKPPGEPVEETPATNEAGTETIAESPKPEPPRTLKFTIYFIYREEEWVLDLANTLRNLH